MTYSCGFEQSSICTSVANTVRTGCVKCLAVRFDELDVAIDLVRASSSSVYRLSASAFQSPIGKRHRNKDRSNTHLHRRQKAKSPTLPSTLWSSPARENPAASSGCRMHCLARYKEA